MFSSKLNKIIFNKSSMDEIQRELNSVPNSIVIVNSSSFRSPHPMEFFSDLSGLNFTALTVNCSGHEIPKDVDSLYQKNDLKILSINDSFKKNNFEVSNFPELIFFSADWFPKLRGLGELNNLKQLHLLKYKPKSKNLSELSNLKQLKTLKLGSGNYESLKGIDELKQLKTLRLYQNSKLKVEEGVVLESIEELYIDGCKLIDVSFYKNFPNVKTLFFDKNANIETLKPVLDGLKNLTEINVCGANILEEDNSYWLDYKKIKSFNFKNKRHHKLKTKDFPNYPY